MEIPTDTTAKEVAMSQFSHIQHGLLPVGTETPEGVIEQVSFTAYRIGERWVPFATIHGPYKVAEPLVVLG